MSTYLHLRMGRALGALTTRFKSNKGGNPPDSDREKHAGQLESERSDPRVDFYKEWTSALTESDSAIETQRDKTLEKMIASILSGRRVDTHGIVLSREIHLFVSSTFTDFALERNCLMTKVHPFLRQLCETGNLSFHPVDLRWGIRNESTNDHLTTDICRQELDRCRALSIGPFAVVFLGNKYGYRPFPHEIPQDEFERIIASPTLTPDQVSIANEWFRLDTNLSPPAYILLPISSHLPDFVSGDAARQQAAAVTWWGMFQRLQTALRLAADDVLLDTTRRDLYHISVTHQEVLNAISGTNETKQTFVFIRNIRGIDSLSPGEHASLGSFIDLDSDGCVDSVAQQWLEALKVIVRQRLPAQNLFEFDVSWPLHEETEAGSEYIERFTREFALAVGGAIRGVAQAHDSWLDKNRLFSEVFGHWAACLSHTARFAGRVAEKGTLLEYARPVEGTGTVGTVGANPLCAVVGPSGVGKTALLSEVARQVSHSSHGGGHVVLRLLGTSPLSSNASALVQSLTSQLKALLETLGGVEPNPTNAEESAVERTEPSLFHHTAEFQKTLSVIGSALEKRKESLLLVLDSLDQLEDSDQGRQLSWLPRTYPANIKCIVSTLPDEGHCYAALQSQSQSQPLFLHLSEFDSTSIQNVLDHWLGSDSRTLSAAQRELFLSAALACPIPLYLDLLYRESRYWHSFDELSPQYPSSVEEMILRLFASLEAVHGTELVQSALTLISLSRDGLSDIEALDLISCNSAVLDAVFQYHVPPIRRLPDLVWRRLLISLSRYLVRRGSGGTEVLNWYHRQFGKAVRRRYLQAPHTALTTHRILAAYFSGNLTDLGDTDLPSTHNPPRAETRGSLQPLILSGSLAVLTESMDGETSIRSRVILNTRRLRESAYHWLEAGDVSRAFECLCDPCYTVGAFMSGMEADYLSELQDLVNRTEVGTTIHTHAEEWLKFVKVQRHVLTQYPGLIWQQAMNHTPTSFVRQNADKLPYRTQWLRHMFAHDGPLFTVSLPAPVVGCDVCPATHTVLAACSDGTLLHIDARVGTPIRQLTGHQSHVSTVRFSACGKFAVSGDSNGQLMVWDMASGKPVFITVMESGIHAVALTGESIAAIAIATSDNVVLLTHAISAEPSWDTLHTLTAHTGSVSTVDFSRSGDVCISGGYDNQVIVWDVISGEQQCVLRCTARVTNLALSPDESLLAIALDSGTIEIHTFEREPATTTVCLTKTMDIAACAARLSCVRWEESARILVSSGLDGGVKLWEVGKDSCNLIGWRCDHSSLSVQTCALSRQSTTLCSGGADKTIRISTVSLNPERVTLPITSPLRFAGHLDRIRCADINPAGTIAATGGWDGILCLWNTHTSEKLFSFPREGTYMRAVSFHPRKPLVAAADAEGLVVIRNTKTGKQVQRTDLSMFQMGILYCCRYSNSGKQLAFGGKCNQVLVWTTAKPPESGLQNLLFPDVSTVSGVVFSPDDKRLSCCSRDGCVITYAIASGEVLWVVKSQAAFSSVAWSKDAAFVATTAWAGHVTIYRSGDGVEVAVRHMDSHGVGSAFFSGGLVAACLEAVHVYRWGTWECETLALLPSQGATVRVSEDTKGTPLIAVGCSNSLSLYRLETAA